MTIPAPLHRSCAITPARKIPCWKGGLTVCTFRHPSWSCVGDSTTRKSAWIRRTCCCLRHPSAKNAAIPLPGSPERKSTCPVWVRYFPAHGCAERCAMNLTFPGLHRATPWPASAWCRQSSPGSASPEVGERRSAIRISTACSGRGTPGRGGIPSCSRNGKHSGIPASASEAKTNTCRFLAPFTIASGSAT